MKRLIVGIVTVGVLLTGCGAASSSTADTAAPAASTSATSKAPAPAASTPAPSPSQTEDGDWKFGKVVTKSTFGVVTATVRATNVTGESRSGLFTVTYFDKGGNILGTANGAANNVAANKSVTVQLLGDGTDIPLKKIAKYEIQVDSSF